MRLLACLLCALLLISPAMAKKKNEPMRGFWTATVQKVVDSDSVKVIVRIGTDIYQEEDGRVWPGIYAVPGTKLIANIPVSIRLDGIDTPEKRSTGCKALYGGIKSNVPDSIIKLENKLGKEATAIVAGDPESGKPGLIKPGDTIIISKVFGGKYFGRVIGEILLLDGRNLSDILLDRGLAVPYDGKTKEAPWCLPNYQGGTNATEAILAD